MKKMIIFFMAAMMLFVISCKVTKCDMDMQTALNRQCVEAGHVRGHIKRVSVFGNLYYCVQKNASLMPTAEPVRNCK